MDAIGGLIGELIGQYVFPIAACVALFVENREQRESHREEMERFTTVIEANTLALTKLTVHLEEVNKNEK